MHGQPNIKEIHCLRNDKEVTISCSSCQTILSEGLRMIYMSANIIPWLQTEEHKENHLSVVSDLFECAENYENLFKILQGHEM
jgi:hypothetical protein